MRLVEPMTRPKSKRFVYKEFFDLDPELNISGAQEVAEFVRERLLAVKGREMSGREFFTSLNRLERDIRFSGYDFRIVVDDVDVVEEGVIVRTIRIVISSRTDKAEVKFRIRLIFEEGEDEAKTVIVEEVW